MTATDRLRAMLDERGVEWKETMNTVGCVFTWWKSSVFGCDVLAMDNDDGTLHLGIPCLTNYTPEQAIAATLGAGTCRLPETRIDHGSIEYNGTTSWRLCSACGAEVLADPANFCPNCGAKVEKVES